MKYIKQTQHGLRYTPEYSVWTDMVKRTTNPKCSQYKNYGAKGIKVCKRWRESFKDFYEDMGERPSSDYSIDRIDNEGDYEPSNCRWATKRAQSINRRLMKGNKSGVAGVYELPSGNWEAKVFVFKKHIRLGTYATKEKAVAARVKAVEEYYKPVLELL